MAYVITPDMIPSLLRQNNISREVWNALSADSRQRILRTWAQRIEATQVAPTTMTAVMSTPTVDMVTIPVMEMLMGGNMGIPSRQAYMNQRYHMLKPGGGLAPSGDAVYDYISGKIPASSFAATAADPVQSVAVSDALSKINIMLGVGVGATVLGMVLGFMSGKKEA